MSDRPVGSRTFGLILTLALVLRAGWALAVPVVPVSDGHAYDVFARNLALHGVYGWEPGSPSAYWPVGTSFIYSLLYRAFGVHYTPIVVMNVVLGVLIVALTVVLAQRWYGRRTAILAGVLLACWPSMIEFSTVLASELPFMALVLGTLALWSGAGRTVGRLLAAGALLGAACYVRPTALLLPAVLVVLPRAPGETRARRVKELAVVLAVAALSIAPWSIRNTRLFDRFVLLSTNGGANTWMGNNPGSSGQYMELPPLDHLDEARRDAYLAGEARRYIVENPLRFVAATAAKMVRLHDRESIGVRWNEEGLRRRMPASGIAVLKLLGNLFWWATVALAAGGVAVLARREGLRVALEPAVVTWGYFAAVHAVTVVQDRYHFPSIPFIGMLAAVAIGAAVGHLKRGATEVAPARVLP